MTYTKSTFEMVAKVLRESYQGTPAARYQNEGLARSFADTFAGSNPRFDRARFLKACGVGENLPHVSAG